MRQTHSVKKIAKIVGRGKATIWRAINEHDIRLTPEGKKRILKEQASDQIGKVPWNRGVPTPQETRDLISQRISGEANAQYGRKLTDEEKEQCCERYFATDCANRMREWLQSPAGKETLRKTIATIRTPEFRAASSKRATEMMVAGKLKTTRHFKQGWHESPKTFGDRAYYRSSYELRYYKMLDVDDEVVAYEAEPFSIEYEFLGAVLNYTPDVMVYFNDQRLRLVEIKPKRMLTWDKNVAKIRAAIEYCAECKMEFATITEDNLD